MRRSLTGWLWAIPGLLASWCVGGASARLQPQFRAAGDASCCVSVNAKLPELLTVVGMSKRRAQLIDSSRTCTLDTKDALYNSMDNDAADKVMGLVKDGPLCMHSAGKACTDLNTASESELADVDGVGAELAEDLVEARTCGFQSKEDMERRVKRRQGGAGHWEAIEAMFDLGILCAVQPLPEKPGAKPITTTTTTTTVLSQEELEENLGRRLHGLKIPVLGLPAWWRMHDYGYLRWEAGTHTLTLEVTSEEPNVKVTSRTYVFSLVDMLIKDGKLAWPSGTARSLSLTGEVSFDTTSVEDLQAIMTADEESLDDIEVQIALLIDGLRIPVIGLPNAWGTVDFGYLSWRPDSASLRLFVPYEEGNEDGMTLWFDPDRLEVRDGGFEWTNKPHPRLAITGKINETDAGATDASDVKAVMTGEPNEGDDEEGTTEIEEESLGFLLNGWQVPVQNFPEEWNTAEIGFISWDATEGTLTMIVPIKKFSANLIAKKFFFYPADIEMEEPQDENEDRGFRWPCRQNEKVLLIGQLSGDSSAAHSVYATLESGEEEESGLIIVVGRGFANMEIPVLGLPDTWKAKDYGILTWEPSAQALTLDVPSVGEGDQPVQDQRFFFYTGDFGIDEDLKIKWPCRLHPNLVLQGQLAKNRKTVSDAKAVMTQDLVPRVGGITEVGRIIGSLKIEVPWLPEAPGGAIGELTWIEADGKLVLVVPVRLPNTGEEKDLKFDFLPGDLEMTNGAFIWISATLKDMSLHGKVTMSTRKVWGLRIFVKRTETLTGVLTRIGHILDRVQIPLLGFPESWGVSTHGYLSFSTSSNTLTLHVPLQGRQGKFLEGYEFKPSDFSFEEGQLAWPCRKTPTLVIKGSVQPGGKVVEDLVAEMKRSPETITEGEQVTVIAPRLSGMKIPVYGLPVEFATRDFGFLTWDADKGCMNLQVPTKDTRRQGRQNVIAMKFEFWANDFKLTKTGLKWTCKQFASVAMFGTLSSDQQSWTKVYAHHRDPDGKFPSLKPKLKDIMLLGPRLNRVQVPVTGFSLSVHHGYATWTPSEGGSVTLAVSGRRYLFVPSGLRFASDTFMWTSKDEKSLILHGRESVDGQHWTDIQAILRDGTTDMREGDQSHLFQVKYVGRSLQGKQIALRGVPRTYAQFGYASWGRDILYFAVRTGTYTKRLQFLASDIKFSTSTFMWTCKDEKILQLQGTLKDNKWAVVAVYVKPIGPSPHAVYKVSAIAYALKKVNVPVSGLPADWGAQNYGTVTWDGKTLTLRVVGKLATSQMKFKPNDVKFTRTNFKWASSSFPSMVLQGTVTKDRRSWEGVRAINTIKTRGRLNDLRSPAEQYAESWDGMTVTVQGLQQSWQAQGWGQLSWKSSTKTMTLEVQTLDRKGHFAFDFLEADFKLVGREVTWSCRKHPFMSLQGTVSVYSRTVSGLKAVAENKVRKISEALAFMKLLDGSQISPSLPSSWNVKFTEPLRFNRISKVLSLPLRTLDMKRFLLNFQEAGFSLKGGALVWNCQGKPGVTLQANVKDNPRAFTNIRLVVKGQDQGDSEVSKAQKYGMALDGWHVDVQGLQSSWQAQSRGQLAWARGEKVLTLTVYTVDRQKYYAFTFQASNFHAQSKTLLVWRSKSHASTPLELIITLSKGGSKIVHAIAKVPGTESSGGNGHLVGGGEHTGDRGGGGANSAVQTLLAGLPKRLLVPVSGLPAHYNCQKEGEIRWNAGKQELVLDIRTTRGTTQRFTFYPNQLRVDFYGFVWTCSSVSSLSLRGAVTGRGVSKVKAIYKR